MKKIVFVAMLPVCGEFQFMQQWESENDLCNEIATHSFRD
jgi:hypothetical protein